MDFRAKGGNPLFLRNVDNSFEKSRKSRRKGCATHSEKQSRLDFPKFSGIEGTLVQ
jgi:hypothetical protein